MKMKNIPPAHLSAACTLLHNYCPELSPSTLVNAIRQYDEEHELAPARLLDKHEAARLVGLSWWTLIDHAKAGRVPGAVKINGTRWRFDEDKLRSWSR